MSEQPTIRTTASGYPIFGDADERTVQQLERCATFTDDVAGAALMADGHLGYSMPIGGVVAHREHVSPSGVGYDIGCIVEDTPVLLADLTEIPIQDVTEYDRILCVDDNGVLREVYPNLGAVQRGWQQVMRLRLADGSELRATGDHQIRTTVGWVRTDQLQANIHKVICVSARGWMRHVPVASVEPHIELPVWDIVTGDDAQCFIAGGIAVHNCGNKAVRTDLTHDDIRADLPALMDQIASDVSFGLGRTNSTPVEHPVLDDSAWSLPQISHLRERAISQLGTVGSGNHYVDLMVDEADGAVWIAVHFGSRGFGHGVASGFLNLAAGRAFDAKAPGETMEQPPTLIPIATDIGESYIAAMELAKRYAYAGRDVVVDQVARILGTSQTMAVHNNHNDASLETHGGEDVWVVRKGATPAFPGQLGFIGGSMCDQAVIIRGKDSPLAREALHSAPHGAGRIMSRTRAAGKWRRVDVGGRKRRMRVGGEVTPERMRAAVADYGIELRGGGVDESPFVYRRLADVLAQHSDTIDVVHTLRPIGVAMAGADVADPFKD